MLCTGKSHRESAEVSAVHSTFKTKYELYATGSAEIWKSAVKKKANDSVQHKLWLLEYCCTLDGMPYGVVGKW